MANFVYTQGRPGGCFSKAPETFRARKAIFSSSVSKHGEAFTLETSCMKGTSVHIKNMRIKQLFNRKVRDFAVVLRARKVSGFSGNGPQGVLRSLGRTRRHPSAKRQNEELKIRQKVIRYHNFLSDSTLKAWDNTFSDGAQLAYTASRHYATFPSGLYT